jgi:hypothetical protein
MNAVIADIAGNSMNATTTDMVGRSSRITQSVRRGCDVLRPEIFWAKKRAEPWVTVRHENYRRGRRTGLATPWARLGERKGVAKVIGMKSESASRTPAVVREPRPTTMSLRITFISFPAIAALTAFPREPRPTNYEL